MTKDGEKLQLDTSVPLHNKMWHPDSESHWNNDVIISSVNPLKYKLFSKLAINTK